MYQVREVDALDDEIVETLTDLHRLTFFDCAPLPKFNFGNWWLALHGTRAVGFAGVVPSIHERSAGYYCRVGVLKKHRGSRLQLRLTRALERCARLNGWKWIVSDTTGNCPSANNFIRAGYRLYEPEYPWGWANTLYWRKAVG